MNFANPSREEIRALLERSRTIAVVGLSDDPARPSYGVTRAMQRFSYRIVPVNPTLEQWQGLPAYADLDAAVRGSPEPIDIVNVFRRSEYLPDVVRDAAAVKAGAVWAQLGVEHRDAITIAQDADMPLVMDRCIKVEYMRLGIERV